MSRTSIAYAQRPLLDVAGDPLRLFAVGANFTRSEMVKDPVTGLWLPGFRLEPERENLCLHAAAFDNPWWTWGQATPTANAGEAPTGETTADKFTEDSTDNYHAVTSGLFAVAAAKYAISVDIELLSGGRSYCQLLFGNSGQWVRTNFDLATVTKLTIDTPEASGIEPLGNGRYRIWLMNTCTAGNADLRIFSSTADVISPSYQGDGRDNYLLWGAQCEAGLYPSSNIITAAAAATRTADGHMRWYLDGMGLTGTVFVPILIPEHTPTAEAIFMRLYDNASEATEHIRFAMDTSGKLKIQIRTAGGSNGDITVDKNICDGNLHWVGASWKPGHVVGWVDYDARSSDIDVGIPPNLDRYMLSPTGAWIGGCSMWTGFQQRPPSRSITQTVISIPSAIERLWDHCKELTVNGQAITPDYWLDGNTGLNSNAKTWTCRQTGNILSLVGSGSDPDFERIYNRDRGVAGVASGKYFQVSDGSILDVTTEDLIVLAAIDPAGSLGFLIDKQAGEACGWGLLDSGSSVVLRLKTSSTTTDVGSSVYSDPFLFVGCINRDEASTNGAYAFNNAVPGTGVDMSARSGTLSNSAQTTVLDRLITGAVFTNTLLMFAVYRVADLWSAGATGATQMQDLATELTNIWLG